MKKIIAAIVTIVTTVIFLSESWAFWSIGIPVHADITKEALSSQFSFNSKPYSFSSKQLSLILTANRNQDVPESIGVVPIGGVYVPEDHFDSKLLKGSVDLLLQRITDLEFELNEPEPDPAIVPVYLGQIAHAAQDFYAHSNWVAAGNSQKANFTSDMFSSQNYPMFFDQSTEAACSDPATLLTNGLQALTTGYYDPLKTPAGQCDHGWRKKTASMATDALFGGCADNLTKDGINHDNGCFDANADVDIFASAYVLAVKETTAILTKIVKDLETDGNTIGFCLLLGLNEANAPCNFSATANSTAQSLQIGTPMPPFSPLTASGGYMPYTYSYSGTLPDGLSFNSTTGVVSGTPKSVYPTSNIIFDVRDSAGDVTNAKTTSTVAFTVADAQCPPSLTADLTTVANAFPFYLPQPIGLCFVPSGFALYTNALRALPEYSIPSCVSIINNLISAQSNVPPVLPICP